jgi:signal transduction histidine kinase
VRRLVEGLGPDSSLGLVEALQAQVDVFDAPTLHSSLHVDPDEVRHLPAVVEAVTVRVVREALANTARHARADACTVHVNRAGNDLAVSVRDNGIGVAASQADAATRGTGVGLLSMRAVAEQIGGVCTVLEAPGGGTEVRLVLPVPAPP